MLNGTLSFVANRAEPFEGGALYIQEFAQIKLCSGAEMEFINNTGRYHSRTLPIIHDHDVSVIPRIGSAIVVDVQMSSPVFSELVYNPQCFLIHENATLPPTRWNNVRQ